MYMLNPLARKFTASAFFAVSCCFLLPLASSAEDQLLQWQPPNWDRDLAVLAAARVNTDAEIDHLLRIAVQDSGTQTLDALNQLSTRPDWPAPAREAALLQFTNQLRQLPPFSVDETTLDFLLGYQNLTLVAHDESSRLGVALYPVHSAARGLLHQWTRQQATQDASALLTQDPQQLIADFLASSDVNIRAGIELALGNADEAGLQALLDSGLPLLTSTPELTGLLGKSAVYLGDGQLVTDVLARGHGPGLLEIIRRAGQHFSKTQVVDVLLLGIGGVPVSTAAMLIAELAPYSIDVPEVSVALMSALEHAELGSTAALALAKWGSQQQREALIAFAASDRASLAAKRVETALSLSRPDAGGSLR